MSKAESKGLRKLGRLYGVLPEFQDSSRNWQVAEHETLLGVLRALGAPLRGMADVGEAIRTRRHALRTCRLEPVTLAWGDATPVATLRLPESLSAVTLDCTMAREDGSETSWTVAGDSLERTGAGETEGERYLALRLPLDGRLPAGYHRLKVRIKGDERESLVIAAPERVFEAGERTWGVFCPLYALHRASSWGAGDFSDLEALMDWTAGQGGGLAATLPMLASFFDGKATVSPYSPASRLFGNEFYLDLARVSELARSEAARALIDGPEFRREVEALRSEPLVDYARQMALKRRVLELLADAAFDAGAFESPAFRRFLAEHPEAELYASFRAAGERHGRRWRDWPAELRDRREMNGVDARARRYHLYAQWQYQEQLRALADDARVRGLSWYVDFPAGVDPDSFDAWRWRELFVGDVSMGCPPDGDFTEAQDWLFPPLHPERQRESGYAYMIAALREHFRHAGALRLDHVMGLHRLYWIPRETGLARGAYVRYPEEELYAILSVESHRRGAWVVGEDLGTVPAEVPAALRRHGVRGLYVIEHELKEIAPDHPLRSIDESVVASINTHDMPPFASYWDGLDIEERASLGLLSDATAAKERRERPLQRAAFVAMLRERGLLGDSDDAGSVLRACTEFLAASSAGVVLVNLEDLWLETEPQNTPATSDERPNWRRKLRRSFEEFGRMPEILDLLHIVDELRREPDHQRR
jgi:4-alpha-glucanotransferase